MKINYMLIIISILLGILVGITVKEYSKTESTYIDKDKLTKKEIKQTNKEIKSLYKEVDNLQKDMIEVKSKYENKPINKSIDELKKELSYTDIKGSGIIVEIDAANEEIGNIANLIDYNKILINIVNELKINGAKFISINGQRINQYSEIVLAGNHININSMPIAPPYEFKVIGDKEKLSRYVIKDSEYIESIKKNYPIKIYMKTEDNININKINIPNKLKYIGGN